MKIEELIRTGLSRVETVITRTALNPLLWLVGLSLPMLLGAAVLIADQAVRLALIGLAALPICLTAIAYFLLLFRAPERLQSEEYRLRQRALQILYRKGSGAEIVDVANQPPRLEVDKRKGPK